MGQTRSVSARPDVKPQSAFDGFRQTGSTTQTRSVSKRTRTQQFNQKGEHFPAATIEQTNIIISSSGEEVKDEEEDSLEDVTPGRNHVGEEVCAYDEAGAKDKRR